MDGASRDSATFRLRFFAATTPSRSPAARRQPARCCAYTSMRTGCG